MFRSLLVLLTVLMYGCSSGQAKKKTDWVTIQLKAGGLLHAYKQKNDVLASYCQDLEAIGVVMNEIDSLRQAIRQIHPISPSNLPDIDQIKTRMDERMDEQKRVDNRFALLMQKIERSHELKDAPATNEMNVQITATDKEIADIKKAYLKTIQ